MSIPGKAILVGFLTAIGTLGVGVSPVCAAAAALPKPAAEIPKRILVLYDEDKDNFPGLATIDRSVRESFRSGLGSAV